MNLLKISKIETSNIIRISLISNIKNNPIAHFFWREILS